MLIGLGKKCSAHCREAAQTKLEVPEPHGTDMPIMKQTTGFKVTGFEVVVLKYDSQEIMCLLMTSMMVNSVCALAVKKQS
jgi:hypothetical protein